jgi:hypothetical protein
MRLFSLSLQQISRAVRAAKNFGSGPDPTLTLRLLLGQIDIEILTLAKIFSLLLGAAVWSSEPRNMPAL